MELVFTYSNTIGSRLVRFFTKRSWLSSSRVSHVAIKYSGEEDKWMVEAVARGLLPNFWPRFKLKGTIYKRFKILGTDEKILENIAETLITEYLFTSYDYFAFVGFGLTASWFQLTGKKIKNFLGKKGIFLCSEFGYRFCSDIKKETNIEYVPDLHSESVWPEELLIELEKRPTLYEEIIEE